jgi:hypothetical protein
MSRKIIQTSGFENVLSRATGKYYLNVNSQATANGQHHLKAVYDYLSKEQNQKLFCGAGLIVGSIKRKGDFKRIAGPLIYCLADCQYENQHYAIDLDGFSISLNHDLITATLETDEILDEETEDARQLTMIAPVFQSISDGFVKGLSQGKETEVFRNPDRIKRVFDKIKEGAGEFRSIADAQGFDKNNLTSYFAEPSRMQFFADAFYFVAPFPNQLSTYEALGRLIKQVT